MDKSGFALLLWLGLALAVHSASPFMLDLDESSGYTRADVYREASARFKMLYALPDSYALLPFQGWISFRNKNEFMDWACADAFSQNYRCRRGKVFSVIVDDERPLNIITIDGSAVNAYP